MIVPLHCNVLLYRIVSLHPSVQLYSEFPWTQLFHGSDPIESNRSTCPSHRIAFSSLIIIALGGECYYLIWLVVVGPNEWLHWTDKSHESLFKLNRPDIWLKLKEPLAISHSIAASNINIVGFNRSKLGYTDMNSIASSVVVAVVRIHFHTVGREWSNILEQNPEWFNLFLTSGMAPCDAYIT